MKYEYIKDAFQLLCHLSIYVNNWYNMDDVLEATEKVFWNFGKYVSFCCGSSRFVLVGKNFVIKWDYDEEVLDEIGGCEDELKLYKEVRHTTYNYLFAPCMKIKVYERYFYIMPRIENIGKRAHGNKTIENFLTMDELLFLQSKVGDLHGENWGLKNNKPVIIDYACKPGQSY